MAAPMPAPRRRLHGCVTASRSAERADVSGGGRRGWRRRARKGRPPGASRPARRPACRGGSSRGSSRGSRRSAGRPRDAARRRRAAPARARRPGTRTRKSISSRQVSKAGLQSAESDAGQRAAGYSGALGAPEASSFATATRGSRRRAPSGTASRTSASARERLLAEVDRLAIGREVVDAVGADARDGSRRRRAPPAPARRRDRRRGTRSARGS